MGLRVKIIILTRVQERLQPPLVIFRHSFQLTYYYAKKLSLYQVSRFKTYCIRCFSLTEFGVLSNKGINFFPMQVFGMLFF